MISALSPTKPQLTEEFPLLAKLPSFTTSKIAQVAVIIVTLACALYFYLKKGSNSSSSMGEAKKDPKKSNPPLQIQEPRVEDPAPTKKTIQVIDTIPTFEPFRNFATTIRNIHPIFASLFKTFRNEESTTYETDLASMGAVIINLNTQAIEFVERTKNTLNTTDQTKDTLKQAARLIAKYAMESGLLNREQQGATHMEIDFTFNKQRLQNLNLHIDSVRSETARERIKNNIDLTANNRWENGNGNDALFFIYDEGDGPLVPTIAIGHPSPKKSLYKERETYRNEADSNPEEFYKRMKQCVFYPDIKPLTDMIGFRNHDGPLHTGPSREASKQFLDQKTLEQTYDSTGLFTPSVENRAFIRFAVTVWAEKGA